MKKKLFVTLVFAFVMILALAISTSAAEAFTHAGKVDINATVTLSGELGTVRIFDDDGNALTWYLDANNELKSIRTDDQQIWWHTESWDEVTNVGITFTDGTTVEKTKFVVVNMMDDDVVKNKGASAHFGKPVTNFKHVFSGCTNLEYLYLRLDTTGFFQTAFQNSAKLKYINVEDLTMLTNSRGGQQFSGCTSLFEGQILDLSKTKLVEINGGGVFNKVPIKGLILPTTFNAAGFGEWAFQENPTTSFVYPDVLTSVYNYSFKNCKNLQTVYLNGSIASVGKDAFLNCSKLEKIFFVGTKTQLETMLANTDATGNNYFLALTGENNANIISYADYQKLQDKSGKYMVYDYSYCEAFKEGAHTKPETINSCTNGGNCTVCSMLLPGIAADHVFSQSIIYADGFAKAGVKTFKCTNWDKCTAENQEIALLPIFNALEENGYSTNGEGIAFGGYTINIDALNEYNDFFENDLSFGIIVANPKYLGDTFMKDGEVNATGGFLMVDMTSNEYTNIKLMLDGFTGNAKNLSLVITLYAYTDVNDVEFIQSEDTLSASAKVTKTDATLYTVTLDSVKAQAGTAIPELPEYVVPSKEQE